MREEVELLEYHADFLADFSQSFRIAALGRELLAVHFQCSGFIFFKAVHTANQGGFAGAAGADNNHHFALFNGKVNIFKDMQFPEVLVHALHFYNLSHG